MDIRLLIFHLLALSMPVFSSGLTYPYLETPDNPSINYTYSRFSEIHKHCSSVLPSPFELKPDDNRGNRIKTELSFLNGEWDQESDGAPLMPSDVIDMWMSHSSLGSFLKLVSFWVMDVDPVRRSENMISVSGIMHVGISREPSFSNRHSPVPEQSELAILFEGVYMESEENGGERLICLLGTSMRSNSNQVIDSLEPVNGYGYTYNHKSPLEQDNQIMLILRYPKTFTLTTRGVRGEIKSLNEKFDPNYFDKVQISSQLSHCSKYHFGSEEVLKACSPYPYQDKLVDEDVGMFKGEDFCGNLQYFLGTGMFNFVPRWESIGTNDFSRLGPFVFYKEIKARTDLNLENSMLIVQNLKCEPEIEQNKIKTAKVSAVFRAAHSSEWKYMSLDKIGLSGMTLSAEGIWTSSSGQLCMVGCLGLVHATSNTCSSRICLYLPLTVSITQRSIMYGTISSIKETEAHNSLLFEKVTRPTDFIEECLLNKNLNWSYKYSKIIQASSFQTRSELSMLGTKFRKSLLRYPSYHGSDNASLSHLSNELSLGSRAVPYSVNNAQADQTYVEIEVLSLGSLFGRYLPQQYGKTLKYEKQVHSIAERIEISGQLIATGANNVSLFMEGLYDPVVGNMYLIGCKDVWAFPKITNSSMNLERGMDCQIEIKIDYPSKNVRWLINPKVKFSISSSRSEADSLHFGPINLETFPVNYNEQADDILFRKSFEGTLQILTLIMASLCIRQQLRYMKNQEEASAYISLVMLGFQSLSYSIPLITGKEILFKWKTFQPTTYGHQAYQEFKDIDLIIKFQLLVLLTAIVRFYGKVRASRASLIPTHSGKNFRFPSDKLVLLTTLAIHILGFSILHIVREMNATTQRFPNSGIYTNTSSTIKNLLKWLGELSDYSGLIQDFFLLPQIIGNFLWRIQVKPLSKPYYIGFTAMRVLLHAYDYIRDPVYDSIKDFNYNELQNPSSDIYSRHGNIAIAMTMIVLAMIVHNQQKCTNNNHQTAKPSEYEDHALESDLHEKLLMKSKLKSKLDSNLIA